MTLTARAETILGDLQPELQEDGFIQMVIQAISNELDKIDTAAQGIRDGWYPQVADDTYHLLSMWEENLGLPVAPPGSSLTDRRNLVLAHIQKRDVGPESTWVAVVEQALGSTPFTYEYGPADDTITIHIPYGSGTLSAAQTQQLTRAITPAHIDLIAAYDQGFLVEISQVGIEPL